MRVLNNVGAIHLRNRRLTEESQENFNRLLRLLEEGNGAEAIKLSRRMSLRTH